MAAPKAPLLDSTGKKAKDVTVMDLRGISDEVDYFVICTGESDLQLRAVVDAVVDRLRAEAGEHPVSREGEPGSAKWIVLDYFDLVVHVFAPEQRAYYDLDRLYADCPRLDWKAVPVSDDLHAAEA